MSIYKRAVSYFYLLPIMLVGLMFSGAASSIASEVRSIVDVKWLKRRLASNARLKLIDVRPEKDFIAGHIPGAINLPVEHSFEGSRIISLGGVRKMLRRLGVNNSDKLIIYDSGEIRNAAHVFWMFETYGHKDVVVLDGGVAAWTKAGHSLSVKLTKYPESTYIPRMSPKYFATKLSTRLSIGRKNSLIIDARSKDEFKGLQSKAKRAGHIPSAINIVAKVYLDMSSGSPKLKNRKTLASMFSNVNKSKKVVTYCNRGKDSALTYLIMRDLGFKVSIYDGGWLEWGDDLHLPIEKSVNKTK